MNIENINIGPEAESSYVVIATIPVATGPRTVSLNINGTLNERRGQLNVMLRAANGLTFTDDVFGGSFASEATNGSEGGSTGPAGGPALTGTELQIGPSGNSAEHFNGQIGGSFIVTNAGDLEVIAAAGNPQSEALSTDEHVLEGTLTVS